MDIIHLALRTGFTFKKVFGHISSLHNHVANNTIGVADLNSTYSHPKVEVEQSLSGVKKIYGVRIMVVTSMKSGIKTFGPEYIFIAKNVCGLSELYGLVKKSYENFYYFPRLSIFDVMSISENIFVISKAPITDERLDYLALSQSTHKSYLRFNVPRIAIVDNRYPTAEDKAVYELLASSHGIESQTYPQHILTTDEWRLIWPGHYDAIHNTHVVADACESYDLPVAENIRCEARKSLEQYCIDGAKRRGIDISGVYHDRLYRELKLIDEKNFSDYFLIVMQMVVDAKKTMLVGPSRGSSAGSLVCYLVGITEVDPIVHDLIFERFIDINRNDLPDIDIDFPDHKRDKVIKALKRKYGDEMVTQLAAVSTMKPKIAIGEFAQALGIPSWEVDDVKNAIIDRSGGDARAQMRIEDTFKETEPGKQFLEKYPEIELVKHIEAHPRHAGKHAAAVVVCNDDVSIYGGVNTRDGTLMMDKRDAEHLNLLKIDVLGLRTLSILEECAELAGMPIHAYYDLPLDDKSAFAVLNEQRMAGVFQFDGYALRSVTATMPVEKFDDISAITALARPGPLHSGGTVLFTGRRSGREDVEYITDDEAFVDEVKDTYGIIIYQEQLMTIGRNFGGLSWEDVSALRKAASKSLGEEFFNKYRGHFLDGTRKRGVEDEVAIEVWENMVTFGSWGFNKSHAVSYGLISYWTAWAKAHHPLEFAAANLNHARSDDHALKLLREMTISDGIEYIPVDPETSLEKWTIVDGVLVGGLTNIDGIGPAKAKDIIRRRRDKRGFTPAIKKKLDNPKTCFDILFPCDHLWGDIISNPKKYNLKKKVSEIKDVADAKKYIIIGKLKDKNLRDLNEYASVVARGGREVSGPSLFLNFTIEDDTGIIMATIKRDKYEEYGREIVEQGVIDKDWYLIHGKMNPKWRKVEVESIVSLTDTFGYDGIMPEE